LQAELEAVKNEPKVKILRLQKLEEAISRETKLFVRAKDGLLKTETEGAKLIRAYGLSTAHTSSLPRSSFEFSILPQQSTS
jgi:hypothetical protein